MKKRLLSIVLALIMSLSLFSTQAFAAKTLGAETTSSLNLRKGAGTSYAIKLTMPKAAQLIVLSTSSGWSKVMYKNIIGYASASYLKAKTTVKGDFGTGTITGDGVRFRKGAGTSYDIISSYNKGTKMTVTGASGNWYAVKYNGKTGYVSGDYMSIAETAKTSSGTTTTTSATTYEGTVTGSDVRFRTGAGTGYTAVGTVSKGTKLKLTGSQSGWYKFSYNGKIYYISGQYVKLSPKTAYSAEKNAKVTADAAYFRMGPSTAFSLIEKLGKGRELKITGEYNNWLSVKVGDKYGFVYKEYVSVITAEKPAEKPKSDIPAPETKLDSKGHVTGDSVRLRKGPGLNYSVLGYYDTGKELKITGKTGDWYCVDIGGTLGYMSKDYVSMDTGATSGTASKIVEKAKSYLGVPYVYGGASPKGFDCSGLVYYCYGQFGYNLRRGATGQFNNNGTAVSKANLKPGDLVFFSDSVDPIGHVGMYIGDGKFIHASSGKGCVVINNLSDYYYDQHYAGARRIIK